MNWKTILLVNVALISTLGCSTLKQTSPLDSNKSKAPEEPKLLSPKVRKVWIPSKIEGDKYFDGHYMYVIEKQTTWSN